MDLPTGVRLTVDRNDLSDPDLLERVLTTEALELVADLHRTFQPRRAELLAARQERAKELDAGGSLDFAAETKDIREDPDWRVAAPAPGLEDRRVEITGPTDKKMAINALNSRRQGVAGRLRGRQLPAVREHAGRPGQPARLHRRRRCASPRPTARSTRSTTARTPSRWSARAAGTCRRSTCSSTTSRSPAASSTSRSTCCTPARPQIDAGRGPYYYLPKMESHLEARLWNDVFVHAQEAVGIPRGTVRATVLIETYPAAFEMEEILYELREHSAGLNAGRWDYLFSVIKKFRTRGADYLLPDRNAGHDDRAVHARLRRAAGAHLPQARRARDRRHGGLHPEPARQGGQREGAGQGARGQGARGQGRLRRLLGRPPRPGAGLPGGLRLGARRQAQPAGQPARGRRRVGAPTCWT